MTKIIQQHVVPRHRQTFSFIAEFSPALPRTSFRQRSRDRTKRSYGIWRTRRYANRIQSRPWAVVSPGWQRGSIDQSTVTVAFAIVSLLSVVLLGFLYLQQVFGTAAKSGDIQTLEERIINLSEKQRALELQGAGLRSIQTVEDHIKELNFISSENVAYLLPETKRVAFDTAQDLISP